MHVKLSESGLNLTDTEGSQVFILYIPIKLYGNKYPLLVQRV
jgi:hypothetical protein